MKRRGFLGLVASLPFVRSFSLGEPGRTIVGSNWRIDRANKTIRHIGNANGPKATVLQLHRWVQDRCDEYIGNGDGRFDITDPTISTRMTDYHIELENGWRIDDYAASMLCDGMIRQDNATYSSDMQITFTYPNLISFERPVQIHS